MSDEFHVHNTNTADGGDIIQMYGSGNVGKQVHHGQEAPQSVTINDGDYVADDKSVTQLGDTHHHLRER